MEIERQSTKRTTITRNSIQLTEILWNAFQENCVFKSISGDLAE